MSDWSAIPTPLPTGRGLHHAVLRDGRPATRAEVLAGWRGDGTQPRLAALAVTVKQYIMGEALTKIPVWRMIAAPLNEIEGRARAWAEAAGGPAKN